MIPNFWEPSDKSRATMTQQPKKPDGKLSGGANVALWIVSLLVGFCFVPFVNIFPTGYHDTTPDIAKPLIFGGLVALGIRWGLGAMLGERFSDNS
jgi:hypothetical protein